MQSNENSSIAYHAIRVARRDEKSAWRDSGLENSFAASGRKARYHSRLRFGSGEKSGGGFMATRFVRFVLVGCAVVLLVTSSTPGQKERKKNEKTREKANAAASVHAGGESSFIE